MNLEIPVNIPLESYPVCVLCLGPRGGINTDSDLTKDHLIPEEVCGKYNPGLKPLLPIASNKFRLHAREHWKIDHDKFEAYRRRGLIGLFEYLAYDYPRSTNDIVAGDQDFQIVNLFVSVHRSLSGLNGNTPKNFRGEYEEVKDFAYKYVYGWIGRMPNYQMPRLDLSA
ncbi:MAG: hypothetical protein Q7R43_00710 [Candidatus Daviesbacteria bacterium]|nr:hypothetical protein [Candidatus Daviesbacteria bacterium]